MVKKEYCKVLLVKLLIETRSSLVFEKNKGMHKMAILAINPLS